jgi:hypothetical protein
MIYKARELNSYLNNLVLVGQDESGRLEWAGSDEQWYLAEINSIPQDELKDMLDTEESDRYDLSTCHK